MTCTIEARRQCERALADHGLTLRDVSPRDGHFHAAAVTR